MPRIAKKVLFVGDSDKNGNTYLRSRAIERLVESTDFIDINDYIHQKHKLKYRLAFYYQPTCLLRKLNQRIVSRIQEQSYDLVWFEKPIFIFNTTLRYIQQRSILSVSLNPDNAFGPRDDGCWKLYLKNMNLFTHHITQRRSNFKDFGSMQVKNILFMPFCFDKNIHFPEPGISENKKEYDVTFIGTPHDQRIEFIKQLAQKLDVVVNIYSTDWEKFKRPMSGLNNVVFNNAIYGSDYRNVINKSKILLGFFTESNVDEYSRRSFEITACGSFLLSQRSSFQKKFFKEKIQAAYFDNINECAEKINHYLANTEERIKIELAGLKRVQELNIYNDFLIQRMLLRIFR